MATPIEVNEALLQEILRIQTEMEVKMLDKVAKRVKKGIKEVGWTEEKLKDIQSFKREIEKTLKDTEMLTKSKVSTGILEAWLKGKDSVNKQLGLPSSILKELDIPPRIQRLMFDTNKVIEGTSVQILRNTDDAYRKIIGEVSNSALFGVETRQQIAQDALNVFAMRGITGFVDKIGRHWELASYTEMATRTAIARAALQGHIDRSTELGIDLMMVSSVSTTCPICVPWEHVVLSISGNDKDYSSLESAKAAGLFHPNCKHTLFAYTEGITPEVDYPKWDEEMYNATQRQRYNERQIRKWKRRQAVALSPLEENKCKGQVRYWQAKQRALCDKYDLTRKYSRESIRNRIGKEIELDDKWKAILDGKVSSVKGVGEPKKSTKPKKEPKPKAPKIEDEKIFKNDKSKVMNIEVPKPKINYDYLPTLKNLDKRQSEFADSHRRTFNSESYKNAKEIVRMAIDNGELRMRIPDSDVLDIIAKDGRFKNQFEVGKSRGTYNPGMRKEASNKLFGTDIDHTDDSSFEKYGYLGDKDVLYDIESSDASQYGNVVITFKKETMFDRTTYTLDDSLGPGLNERMVASRLNDPKICSAYQSNIEDLNKKLNGKKGVKPSDVVNAQYSRYFELQYHGNVSFDDVESIVIAGKSTKKIPVYNTLEMLKKKGIKVYTTEYDSKIGKNVLKELKF